MKKITALLLTVAMIFSLAVVPASAAEPDVKLKITPNVTSVDTETGDAEVEYTISIEVKDSTVKIGSIQFELAPPSGMTLPTKFKDGSNVLIKYNKSEWVYDEVEDSGIYSLCGYTPSTRRFVAGGTTEERALNTNKTVMVIKATIKAGTTGSLTLCDNASVVPSGDTSYFKTEFGKTDGGSVKWTYAVETTPVVAYSKLSGKLSVDITAPVKDVAPQSAITPTTQYTGTIAWEGNPSIFAANTEYTAHVTLTANTGYQFANGVNPTVTGATGINVVSNDGTTLKFDAKFPQTTGKDALTGKPAISGTPTVGTELTATVGTLNETDPTKLAYQWNRDGVSIIGETSKPYTVKTEDVGKAITVTVTAKTTSEYSGSATSDAVTAINRTLTNLEITTQPSTKTYTHGDPFKADGMKVKAIFNDGSENDAFTGYTVA